MIRRYCRRCEDPLGYRNKSGLCEDCAARKVYNPSPAKIREVCSEIQAGWGPDEERKRRTISVREWEPHEVRVEPVSGD